MSLTGFCPRYEQRYFWTLKEVLDPTNSKESYAINNADILAIANSMTGFSSTIIVSSQWTNANIGKVFDLVIKRFHAFVCYDSLSSEFEVSKQKSFIAKLIAVCEMTSDRYLKLLELYTAQANNLLAPVVNNVHSKNRFNDTPQNNGTYEEDPFTTNISFIDTITEADADTIMGRLREIEGNFNNVLLNWSNEFDSLFMEEDNI